jgi:hypothetical protein
MIRSTLPIVAAVGLLLFSGLVHGLWTDRWQSPESLDAAVARVERVPLTIGDWKGHTLGAPDVDPEAFAQAGALGYWMRRYVHPRDGQEVTAILMCGRRSRIAVHPPEVCYRTAGYDQIDPAVPIPIKSDKGATEPAEFRTTLFTAPGNGPAAKPLRIFWSWNATGEWQAPGGDARWTFRGVPFLYKLYVVHEVAGRGGLADSDAGAAFLRQLIPELDRSLFGRAEE